MAGQISGPAVGAVGIGAVFLYSGITGKNVTAVLQGVIRGQSPKNAAATASISGASPAGGTGGGGGGGPPGGLVRPGLISSASSTANKALGKLMAAAYGWGTGQEWAFLESGWEEESGWSVTAAYDRADPYNHAYGIPQANPGSKMASAGADWKTSAATQIKWGLAYIKAEYGSPTQVPLWSANGPLPGYQGY